MKSNKHQEGNQPTTVQGAANGSPSTDADNSGNSTSAGDGKAVPASSPSSVLYGQSPRCFLRRYWHLLLLFLLCWATGAFFICSPLQHTIQFKLFQQFHHNSLTADFPFSFQDPQRIQEAKASAAEQVPPVFDLKESKVGRILDHFLAQVETLRALPENALQNDGQRELQKLLKNGSTVNLLLLSLKDVLACGILEADWNRTAPPISRYENCNEAMIITDDHQMGREFTSLLTVEEAYRKLAQDFAQRLGKAQVDLSFFQEAELLSATLVYNEEKSQELLEDALGKISVPLEKFQTGDILTDPSPREKAVLDTYFAAQEQWMMRNLNPFALEFHRTNLIRLILLTLFIVSYVFCLSRIRITPANLDQRLMVSAVAMILHFFIIFLTFYLYALSDRPFHWLLCLVPLALISSILANLLGGRIAICTAVIVSALLPLQISAESLQYQLFHYSFFVTLVSVGFFQYAKKRRDYLIGGFAVGFAIMLSQILFALEHDTLFTTFPALLPQVLVFSYGNGFLTALLCMVLLPVFESCFGLDTLTTLLELNDTNHPLLRRMQQEAPGTFQHSLTVASIAEAAANAIQANALLTRDMALFHDIGKLENPGFFAENMGFGANPHDALPPEESCQIITAHVRDGLTLAKKYHLRKSICTAIEQHHGNSILAFFYEKAKREAQANNLPPPEEAQFRYPHTPPLQKEIVIVCLADACEAAVRSIANIRSNHSHLLENATALLHAGDEAPGEQERRLKEFLQRLESESNQGPTAEKVEQMVDKIINEKWSDNQFDAADITTSELEEIRKSFLKTFRDMYHFRPQYPDQKEKG